MKRKNMPYLKDTLLYAIKRLSKDNLTQVASSLTFTTVLALVPLFALMLSLFTAFPLFGELQLELEAFLTSNLMPEAMANNIMSHLNNFAEQARKMSTVGAIFLVATSILLVKTIDNALNKIWHVDHQRPFITRFLMYWAFLSIGPFMLAASVWASSFITRAHTDIDISLLQNLISTFFPSIISFVSFSLLYFIVPNRIVYLKDAMIGGVVAAILFELMKSGFTFYISKFPSYTLIYGTFATIPLFLIWIYLSWLVILFGAVIASIMPQLRFTKITTHEKVGADFIQAIHILRALFQFQHQNPPGRTTSEIIMLMKGGTIHTQKILEKLAQLGYIVRTQDKRDERWVLAQSPEQSLIPLRHAFLINAKLDKCMGDSNIRHIMSQLILNKEVYLKDILVHAQLATPMH